MSNAKEYNGTKPSGQYRACAIFEPQQALMFERLVVRGDVPASDRLVLADVEQRGENNKADEQSRPRLELTALPSIRHKHSGRRGNNDRDGGKNTSKSITSDETSGVEDTLRTVVVRAGAGKDVDEAAEEDRGDVEDREVEGDGEAENGQAEANLVLGEDLVDHDDDRAETKADTDVVPLEATVDDTDGDGADDVGLGRSERAGVGAADGVGLLEELEDGGDDERRGRDTDHHDDLLTPRGSAKDVTTLEILDVVTGDGTGTGNGTADHDCEGRADGV
mmetsp:Transcript_18923/g.60497  ORF Transcript_18923/g.60497 Transcript_18923/m.60497 type:complete len:278 (-) Transcript_18923:1366-2199(-)